MKGFIITSAAIAISVAALMSQSTEPSKSSAIFSVEQSWTADYHFDRSTNLWM
jgi:hypothetical protein